MRLKVAFYLKKARAITVNTVHGNDMSIKKVQERLTPQLESMEGAAFFYACQQLTCNVCKSGLCQIMSKNATATPGR
jgi:hypothetical protein